MAWEQVATTGRADALTALNLSMSDFEDALKVSAALACQASYVITRNVRDFKAFTTFSYFARSLLMNATSRSDEWLTR